MHEGCWCVVLDLHGNMESKLRLVIFISLGFLSPVFAQASRGIEDITVEEWLAIGALAIGVIGFVACIWIVVVWCICKIEFTSRKTERQRKRNEFWRSSRSPANRPREQPRNTSLGIIPPPSARLDSRNGNIPQATPYTQLPVVRCPETPQQRTDHTDVVSIRTPTLFLNAERNQQLLTRSASPRQQQRTSIEPHQLSRSQLAPTSITHQPIPKVVVTSPRTQLQSLREAEETDVHPDVSEGPPRYNTLFPETVNYSEDTDDTAFQRPVYKTYTSPFNFGRPPRKGEGKQGFGHERSEFSQLNSWPVFQ